jgi:predicted amidohydrolase
MKIAVASPPYPKSLHDGVGQVEKLAKEAAEKGANIICFPESYLPGYPTGEYQRETCDQKKLQSALDLVCNIAAENAIAIIIPMDWQEGDQFLNVAQVISDKGEHLGYQAKNQLDPSEDNIWTPGSIRHIFEVDVLKFGITICHEGFRYPESVRWAARRGAQVVFHPNFSGSEVQGPVLKEWGHKDNPYYEKSQMLRAMENTIYFATSNYASKYPESASAVIAPGGQCIAWQTYGKPGVAIADIDLAQATGLLAKRFRADLYYKDNSIQTGP